MTMPTGEFIVKNKKRVHSLQLRHSVGTGRLTKFKRTSYVNSGKYNLLWRRQQWC